MLLFHTICSYVSASMNSLTIDCMLKSYQISVLVHSVLFLYSGKLKYNYMLKTLTIILNEVLNSQLY